MKRRRNYVKRREHERRELWDSVLDGGGSSVGEETREVYSQMSQNIREAIREGMREKGGYEDGGG